MVEKFKEMRKEQEGGCGSTRGGGLVSAGPGVATESARSEGNGEYERRDFNGSGEQRGHRERGVYRGRVQRERRGMRAWPWRRGNRVMEHSGRGGGGSGNRGRGGSGNRGRGERRHGGSGEGERRGREESGSQITRGSRPRDRVASRRGCGVEQNQGIAGASFEGSVQYGEVSDHQERDEPIVSWVSGLGPPPGFAARGGAGLPHWRVPLPQGQLMRPCFGPPLPPLAVPPFGLSLPPPCLVAPLLVPLPPRFFNTPPPAHVEPLAAIEPAQPPPPGEDENK